MDTMSRIVNMGKTAGGWVSKYDVAFQTHISESTATRHIKKLMAAGLVKSNGRRGRAVVYRATESGRAVVEDAPAPQRFQVEGGILAEATPPRGWDGTSNSTVGRNWSKTLATGPTRSLLEATSSPNPTRLSTTSLTRSEPIVTSSSIGHHRRLTGPASLLHGVNSQLRILPDHIGDLTLHQRLQIFIRQILQSFTIPLLVLAQQLEYQFIHPQKTRAVPLLRNHCRDHVMPTFQELRESSAS